MKQSKRIKVKNTHMGSFLHRSDLNSQNGHHSGPEWVCKIYPDMSTHGSDNLSQAKIVYKTLAHI